MIPYRTKLHHSLPMGSSSVLGRDSRHRVFGQSVIPVSLQPIDPNQLLVRRDNLWSELSTGITSAVLRRLFLTENVSLFGHAEQGFAVRVFSLRGAHANSLPRPKVLLPGVEQAARACADGNSFACAWHWGDNRGFQRHLCLARQSVSTVRQTEWSIW
jgi:hypothetical protein